MTAGKRRKPQGTHTPDRRDAAMVMLAEGNTVAATARALKMRENTIRDWRDSPAGQKHLSTARQARAEHVAGAAKRARAVLDEAAVRAAQVLVDGLDAKAPNVRVRAAREVLGRVGVPMLTESRVTVADDGADLSRLSLDELKLLDELNRKARGETS